MAKFLIVVPPFFGHLSPTLSVGAGLLAKGHEVLWTGLIPVDPIHIPSGGRYIWPEKSLKIYADQISHILKRQDDGPGLSGPEVMKLALEETYVPMAKMMMKGLAEILETYRPDVIINDCIAFAGALMAHIRGIPCITTTPVPPDVMGNSAENAPEIFRWQQRVIREMQKSVGISGEGIYIHSADLNIVFTSREFAAIENPGPIMRFVGPVQGRPANGAFDWGRLSKTSTPKIFATLGTLLVDIRKAYFSRLTEELQGAPVTVVVASDPSILDRWPDNFMVQSYVPQTELMKHMDLVICHGGFNTVNDTFSNGLPMLITPIAYDHFHTASLILKAGCGLKLRYKRIRKGDIRKAVHELLHNPVYRLGAQRVKATFEAAGGTRKAVELIDDFVRAAVPA